MLVGLIDYDLSKEERDDLVSSYNETLIYKNQLYTFQDGKFIGKDDSNTEIKKLEDHMVLIKRENEKITVTVTNTSDNESTIFKDVKEEDLTNLDKFIKDDEEKKQVQEVRYA